MLQTMQHAHARKRWWRGARKPTALGPYYMNESEPESVVWLLQNSFLDDFFKPHPGKEHVCSVQRLDPSAA